MINEFITMISRFTKLYKLMFLGLLFYVILVSALCLMIASYTVNSINPFVVFNYFSSEVLGIFKYQLDRLSSLSQSYSVIDVINSPAFYLAFSAIFSALMFELVWFIFRFNNLKLAFRSSSLYRLFFSKDKSTTTDRYLISYWFLTLDTFVVGLLGLLGPFFIYAMLSNGVKITTLSDVGVHPVILFLIFVILMDFFSYWTHRWSHALRPFWEFHKFHHGATEMNMVTALRNHPMEMALLMPFKAIVLIIVGGGFEHYLIFTWMNLFIIMLHHSNFDWRWKYLDFVIVTPLFHRLHHSSKDVHFDKNFGVLFSFWDTMFKTRYLGKDEEVIYGVTGNYFNSKGIINDLLKPLYLFAVCFSLTKKQRIWLIMKFNIIKSLIFN
ncbi:MAG: sterol desaturase family protein [Pseudomonadales bacterium]|uniref:sterol desaturase family protein n=1 Tax=Moritella sp. TaxID=78556 RepID=UPI001E106B04|nr:sterol desaturase family protein [Moritella sp.]MCJ8314563.1 sterol desaturase family protein [Pseudomonadales bacterium]NQZ50761.1 sterol desaturase family protein [Moritella sp.]